MSMNGHFLAGSWQMGVHRCLCMLSDVTLDARKPLKHGEYCGSATWEWSFDSPRLQLILGIPGCVKDLFQLGGIRLTQVRTTCSVGPGSLNLGSRFRCLTAEAVRATILLIADV